jgi:hypothetical protein
MKRIAVGLAALAGLSGVALYASAKEKDMKAAGRYFEIRTYTVNDGKMDALHARFRDHTVKLFTKHGIESVGYWTVNSGESAGKTLVFVLAYPSKEEQAKRWKAFAEDPDWKKAKDDSEKNGVLVSKADSRFMDPTDYSPVK